MPVSNDTINILNDLIRTSEDGRKGFQAAADNADDPKLKDFFAEKSHACGAAVAELQQLVSSIGGAPEDTGSAAGTAHRQWVKARAAVGDNNLAVLDEVERGEDVAKQAYARALEEGLPDDIQPVIQKQYEGVLRNHDHVRQLRNQYGARA